MENSKFENSMNSFEYGSEIWQIHANQIPITFKTTINTNRFKQWHGKQWESGPDQDSPLEWRSREMNPQADWLANTAMDRKQSKIKFCYQPECIQWRHWHIRIFTDGGRRRGEENEGSDVAGAGWVVLGI